MGSDEFSVRLAAWALGAAEGLAVGDGVVVLRATKYVIAPLAVAALAMGVGAGTAGADPLDDFADRLGTYTAIGGFAGTAVGAGIGCVSGSMAAGAATGGTAGSLGCMSGGSIGGLVGGAGLGGIFGTLIGGAFALPMLLDLVPPA